MINIECNSIFYRLNKKECTASISHAQKANGDIFIPRSLFHNSQEYIITSIEKESFKDNASIDSIHFPDDSELRSISKNAFLQSSIKILTFPPKLSQLEDGWCKGALFLTHIKISSNNKFFTYLDKNCKIILGKSDSKSGNYDNIVFACRDIDHFTIPATIRRIGSYAFYECYSLRTFNFCEDSKLRSIGRNAFSYSSIESLFVPSSVVELDESWLGDTSELNNVILSSKSDKFAYLDDRQQIIVGKSNSSSKDFDVIVFTSHEIEYAFIPSTIKSINSYAFSYCCNLKTVEFERGSQLHSIGKNAFSNSSIEEITIPESVEQMKKRAFLFCDSLKSVNFEDGSKLRCLDSFLIYGSRVVSFSIPSNVDEIKDDCFMDASELKNVYISRDNKCFAYLNSENKVIVGKSLNGDSFDVVLFACRDVERVFIPPSIRKINLSAFAHCKSLKSFVISEESMLESIGKYSFANSSIVNISIPKSVSLISEKCFSCCKKLKNVVFSIDSVLLNVQKNAFEYTAIENVAVYSNECVLGEKTFVSCVKLKSFEFLGDVLVIENDCFSNDKLFFICSLPNVTHLTLKYSSFELISMNFSLFICSSANIKYSENM